MSQNAASPDTASAGAGAPNSSAAAAISSVLSETAGKLAQIGSNLGSGKLSALAQPLAAIGQALSDSATRLLESAGGAEGSAAGDVGKTNGKDDGGKNGDSEEVVKQRVEKLKGIWGAYYDKLFDEEGKLSAKKAAGIALEVGDTILGTKKMAKVRKALSIANVIRDKAEAIMTAAKSAPFPANLIPIAKAVAVGAAQLGVVKGQAHGGLSSVPSTGTYLLEKGERVVGRRLNEDLQSFLSGQAFVSEGGGGGQGISNSVTNSPSINLTINGDASDDAVASNRGALEGMIRDIFADYAMDAPFG